MLFTKSINKASYITFITNAIGKITEDRNGFVGFAFERSEETYNAIVRYNKAVAEEEGTEKLIVDLVLYNNLIRYYKNKTREYKDNIRY